MNHKLLLDKPLRLIQITLAVLWIYQGLIPKILFQSSAEITIWQSMGLALHLAKICVSLSGMIEIMFGCTFLIWQRAVFIHQLNILGLSGLLLLIIVTDPIQLTTAFNPVVMNIAMITLSILALQLLKLRTQQA
ncbi:DoxX-like family protein [Acinetobacter sp. ANC 4779]|uniref:DoxX-like family protein n=1 Tax=Acinetobacter sp. ANC 4779 TaxID=2529848 RepID=UPI001D18B686|nr:DoxX-like family protein [Acinetobacter sp. ANC 4779]